MTTIGIIGTSGSRNKMSCFDTQSFNKLVKFIEDEIKIYPDFELWSGGSSGIDHIAVLLALKYNCKIKLFLPTEWINGKFYDNGEYSYYKNNGKQLNQLHKIFSQKIGYNTLEQINELIKKKIVQLKYIMVFIKEMMKLLKRTLF